MVHLERIIGAVGLDEEERRKVKSVRGNIR